MSKSDNAAAVAAPRSTTITLDTPIVRGEQTITEVQLRKPQAGELRGIALADLMRLDVAALQTVLPRITTPTLTQHDVNQLDLADLASIGGEVIGFFLTKRERESLSPGA